MEGTASDLRQPGESEGQVAAEDQQSQADTSEGAQHVALALSEGTPFWRLLNQSDTSTRRNPTSQLPGHPKEARCQQPLKDPQNNTHLSKSAM